MRAHFRLALNREQPAWVDVFVGRGYELYVRPLPKRELLVAGLADSRALGEPLDRAFRRWWNSHRTLAWRLEGDEQTSKLLSCALLTGRTSVGVAPGVALLGDAASFSDPITGGGITQALQAAELLATYIASRLGTNEQWLWEFDRDRRALLRDYEILTRTVLWLWLADHAKQAAWALSTLSRCPKLFSHLLGVLSGSRHLLRIETLGV